MDLLSSNNLEKSLALSQRDVHIMEPIRKFNQNLALNLLPLPHPDLIWFSRKNSLTVFMLSLHKLFRSDFPQSLTIVIWRKISFSRDTTVNKDKDFFFNIWPFFLKKRHEAISHLYSKNIYLNFRAKNQQWNQKSVETKYQNNVLDNWIRTLQQPPKWSFEKQGQNLKFICCSFT